jgi:hypothetical protein
VGVDGVMMSLGISSGCEVFDVGCAKEVIVLANRVYFGEWYRIRECTAEEIDQRFSYSTIV